MSNLAIYVETILFIKFVNIVVYRLFLQKLEIPKGIKSNSVKNMSVFLTLNARKIKITRYDATYTSGETKLIFGLLCTYANVEVNYSEGLF